MKVFRQKIFNLVRNGLLQIGSIVIRRLNSPSQIYEQRIVNNMADLKRYIKPGDLVLVEGRTELSRIIKLYSISHWSHVGMYVGDRLLADGSPHAETVRKDFGPEAEHMLVEAFSDTGVVTAPLSKYQDYNIRVCRPFAIHQEDLEQAIEHVIGDLGKQYDNKNILNIALKPFSGWIRKRKASTEAIGSGDELKVICSGMIAKAFQDVRYPIVPVLRKDGCYPDNRNCSPYGGDLVMRHYTQILPRDFDLSPNFEIIKFNIIAEGQFDYRALTWATDAPASNGFASPAIESQKSEPA